MVNHGPMTEFNARAAYEHEQAHKRFMGLPKLPLPPAEEPETEEPSRAASPSKKEGKVADGPAVDYSPQLDALAMAFNRLADAMEKIATKPEPKQPEPEKVKKTVTFSDGRKATIEDA